VHINSEHKGVVVCDLSVAVRKGEYHGDDKHEVRKLKQRKSHTALLHSVLES